MGNYRFCAIIGENPDELEFGYDEDYYLCTQMKFWLAAVIKESVTDGCRHFASTLDQGAAMWGAEICDAVRQLGGDICFTALTTSEEQASRWHPERRERYFSMLEAADEIMESENEHDAYDYMFENADRIIVLGSPVHERLARLIARAEKCGIAVKICEPL